MAIEVRIVLCGFGRVGRGFARLLAERAELLTDRYALDCRLVGVAELGGSLHDPAGMAPLEVIERFETQGDFAGHPALEGGWDGEALLRRAAAGVLVDCTPTDVVTGEPALSHVRTALDRRMHVVSASKGPFIRHHAELCAAAHDVGVALKLSAAAAAALPTLDVAEVALAGTRISRIESVLNGTSNFILSAMQAGGRSYEDALAEAQRLGIAEADPTLDVEGYDTTNKLALIANVAMAAGLTPEDIERTGITRVSAAEVADASAKGRVFRLVGRAEHGSDGRVSATVAPEALASDHPLAAVGGAEKGITYTTDTMDRITVTGGKSDPIGAAAALLKDLINIYRR